MNNKRLGTEWERQFCKMLADDGYWVHFITPDNRGAQPFDIIAVRNGVAYAYDCKTCVSNTFSISRLEDNQMMAFDKWLACGNSMPHIAVLHNDKTFLLPYDLLKTSGKIKLE